MCRIHIQETALIRSLALLFTLGTAVPSFAAAPEKIDLSTLDKGMQGARTQVLVLGTVHLSQMPKGFKPESLQPVLDKLAVFKPGIITIEALSGETCDLMARHPTVYDPQDVATYCKNTDAARTATGLDVPAAIAEMRKTLKTWPANPAPAQRRHLAAVFLAAGEDASALVQWLQLPLAERREGDGLDAALVAQLGKSESLSNEDYLIAARLAARLGLQRVYPADDHTGDNVEVGDQKAYGKAIQNAWDAAAASWKANRDHEQQLSKDGGMLALYRFINRSDVRAAQMDGDFGAALRDASPQRYGRLYVAGWEIRNLRMVSNVHAAFGERPGARVLAIVGASHKPWFDNFLGQMQGVDIVDTEQVLK
jgi:hypothetical protein